MKALIGLKRRLREHQGDRQNYALARAVGDTPFEGVIKSARFVGTHSSSSTKKPPAKPAAGRLQRGINSRSLQKHAEEPRKACRRARELKRPASPAAGRLQRDSRSRVSKLMRTSPAKPAAGRLQRASGATIRSRRMTTRRAPQHDTTRTQCNFKTQLFAVRWAPAARQVGVLEEASSSSKVPRKACRWAPAARLLAHALHGLREGHSQSLPLGACSATKPCSP